MERLHNVNSTYNGNNLFNSLIRQEGKILEEAIKLTNRNNITSKINEFIKTRDTRRNDCGLTASDITNESEFEWLEGMARYAEYIASDGSNSISRKTLSNTSEKSAQSADDRYYALGMAQIILIKKLEIPEWQQKLFYEKYTPEELLREYLAFYRQNLGAHSLNGLFCFADSYF